MSRRRKGVLIIVGIVLFLLAALFFTVTDGLREAVAVEVGSVDLSGVADGSYTGRYDFKRWSAAVRVEVRGHRIGDIILLEDVRAAELTDCADETFRRVLECQTICRSHRPAYFYPPRLYLHFAFHLSNPLL